MGFKTFTEEQREKVQSYFNQDIDILELPTTLAYRNLLTQFESLITGQPAVTENLYSPNFTDMQNRFNELRDEDQLRDENGSTVPEDCTLEDFLLYLAEKDIALAKQKDSDPENAEKERNKMFYFRPINPETNQPAENFIGQRIEFFDKNGKTLRSADTKFKQTEVSVSASQLDAAVETEQKRMEAAEVSTEVVNTYKEAIRVLRKDLMRMDSIFSNDSEEYLNFNNALAALSRELNENPTASPAELLSKFNAPMVNGKSVLQCASEYRAKKATLGSKLSDRQMGRLSIISRLDSLYDQLGTATTVTTKDELTTFQQNITLDTVAQKAMLGTLKSIGTADAKKTYTNASLYQQRLDGLKKGLQGQQKLHPYSFKALVEEASSTKVAEKLAPGKINNATGIKGMQEEIAAALAGMDKNQIPMTVVAQYLLERSATMINELDTELDSFSHSDAYKNFRSSLDRLQKQVAGIVMRKGNGFGPEALSEALDQVEAAAEFYRIQHRGDSLETVEYNVIRRLGMAAELKICKDFLDNPQESLLGEPGVDTTKLFQNLSAHQDNMRELGKMSGLYSYQQNAAVMADLMGRGDVQPNEKLKQDFAAGIYNLTHSDEYNRVLAGKAEKKFEGETRITNQMEVLLEAVTKNTPYDRAIINHGKFPDYTEAAADMTRRQAEIDGKFPKLFDNIENYQQRMRPTQDKLNCDAARGGYTAEVFARLLANGATFDEIMEKNELLDKKVKAMEQTMQKISEADGKDIVKNLVAGQDKLYNYMNEKFSNLKDFSFAELTKPENKNLLAANKMYLLMKQELERSATKDTVFHKNTLGRAFVADEDKAKMEQQMKFQTEISFVGDALYSIMELYQFTKNSREPDCSDMVSAYYEAHNGESMNEEKWIGKFLSVPIVNQAFQKIKNSGDSAEKSFFEKMQNMQTEDPTTYIQFINGSSYADNTLSLQNYNKAPLNMAFYRNADQMKTVADLLVNNNVKLEIKITETNELDPQKFAKSFNAFSEKVQNRPAPEKQPEKKAENLLEEKIDTRSKENNANVL